MSCRTDVWGCGEKRPKQGSHYIKSSSICVLDQTGSGEGGKERADSGYILIGEPIKLAALRQDFK